MSALTTVLAISTVATVGLFGLRSISSVSAPAAAAGTLVRPEPATKSGMPHVNQNYRLTHLVGLTAQNPDGQDLGKLQNFVIDGESGRVRYAIVSSDGLLGIGKTLRIAPLQAVSTATAKRGIVELAISRSRWKHAPPFKLPDLAALNEPGCARGISDYYRHSEYAKLARKAGSRGHSPPLPSSSEDSTGEGAPAQGSRLQLANVMIGQEVLDKHHRVLGRICDLALDLKGRRPVFAILAGGRISHRRQLAVALPMLRSTAGQELVFDADWKAFEPGPEEPTWQNEESGLVVVR